MSSQGSSVVDDRFLVTGDESGTAPGDRRFRPDVEGLRAVAVVLVVLYHASVPGLTGGYIGVDVFFVISGFVITGLLLRERSRTGRTSILGFYARRCRRILPAATLVLLVAVFASYVVLGVVSGNSTADDGRWATVFLANFHFESVGTNYLLAQRPPSPLQNYWSLAVEEQFYLVYPTLFLLVARIRGWLSLRARLAICLGVVIAASYWLSIVQTASHPALAYFSPLTRAWELALGALVAVGTGWLKRLPAAFAALLTWAGLVAVVSSAFAFTAQTAYPGSLVAVPVVGAAMIIAGGAAIPRFGSELVLGLAPFRWLGKLSYSLYLWHWPILIIAAEQRGKTSLPLGDNLLLIALAVGISVVNYRFVENPIRHWRLPSGKSVVAGVGLVLATVALLSVLESVETVAPHKVGLVPAANVQVVLDQVAAATRITTVPTSIVKAEYGAAYASGESYEGARCVANFQQTRVPICTLGDRTGRHLMVVYGDSHALMWIPAFIGIANAEHWRLVVLGKLGCPAVRLTVLEPAGVGLPSGPDNECDAWHTWATNWINKHKPNLLVFSQADYYRLPIANVSPTTPFSAAQWKSGLDGLFRGFRVPKMKMVLLGSTPILARPGPVCLAEHPTEVQVCSTPARLAVPRLAQVDQEAARADHVGYIDTTPWFCSLTCTAIIGDYEVYDATGTHISGVWAKYLQNVLAGALSFPAPAHR
jgi:peptidoglycan/LPS O-acetylase OafA/YrhL